MKKKYTVIPLPGIQKACYNSIARLQPLKKAGLLLVMVLGIFTTAMADENIWLYRVGDGSALLSNAAPLFVSSSPPTTLTVCQNAGATDITSLLHVNDADTSQTETWTQLVAPNQGGTLSFNSATAASGSTNITPGGTINYTPSASYSGTESFTIRVSDGTDFADMVSNT